MVFGKWILTPLSIFIKKSRSEPLETAFFNENTEGVLTLFQIQFPLNFIHKYVLDAFIKGWNDRENAI